MTAQQTVTAAIEAELQRQGLNRSRLADRMGKHRAYVTKKLDGRLRWSMDDLDEVSRALGVPLPVLLMAPVRESLTAR